MVMTLIRTQTASILVTGLAFCIVGCASSQGPETEQKSGDKQGPPNDRGGSPKSIALKSDDEVANLIKRLSDDDEVVRLRTAKALGRLGVRAQDAIPALENTANEDKDPEVRGAAVEARTLIKEAVLHAQAQLEREKKNDSYQQWKKDFPSFVKGLQSDDPVKRQRAIKNLVKYPADSSEVIPTLKTIAEKDPDQDVRTAAREAFAVMFKEAEKPARAVIESLGGIVEVDMHQLGDPVYWVQLSAGYRGTDDDLAYLKAFSHLAVLQIRHNGVTDKGLAYLKGISTLQTLELDGTKVTDAGLVHLKGLTQLRTLSLTSTRVTPEGVEALRKALPNTKIVGPK
jgi:hypothetical protein